MLMKIGLEKIKLFKSKGIIKKISQVQKTLNENKKILEIR